jgi:hypothetical protein
VETEAKRQDVHHFVAGMQSPQIPKEFREAQADSVAVL